MSERNLKRYDCPIPARLVVVEDEGIVALNLRQRLVKLGYEICAVVASGEAALEKILQVKPDLVLMDIHINGEMDGIQTVAKFPPELEIAVIYLTAYSEESMLERARATKPYGYLLKPFSERELHATIQMALERREDDRYVRANEARLNLVLDAAELGAWEVDSTKRDSVNMGRVDQIFGHHDADFKGTWDALLRDVNEEDRHLVTQFIERVMSNRSGAEVEFRRLDPDGRQHWLRAQGRAFQPDVGSRQMRAIGVIEDITTRRVQEDKLHRETLELLAAQEELHTTLYKVDQASRAKSSFLASMSHELRTPLNAILGFAQLLQIDKYGPLNERQAEYVQIIVGSGEHLLHLISDVLDLSTVEAGRLPVSIGTVELMPVVADVIATLEPLADQRGIELMSLDNCLGQCKVLADRTRLIQSLHNLVGNGIKYTPKGGAVTVSCTVLPNNRLRIAITDTGSGIPEDRQRELFEPFNRCGAEYSAVEGTGLGLPLTKRLIELMGGALDFYSAEGDGSTFWIELPMPVEAAKKKPTSRGDKSRSARVVRLKDFNAGASAS